MTPADRNILTSRLYTIHSQIFDGVDPDAFRRYVVEPDTKLSRLYILQNARQEDVGYFTCQVYQVRLPGRHRARRAYIYRTEVGILPAYRGNLKPFLRIFWDIFRFSVVRGIPRAYFMATPVNPLAYKVAERIIGECYPRPGKAIPAPVHAVIRQITTGLDLQPAPGGALARKVGWQVRFSENELQRLNRSQHPAIVHYIAENPGFQEGNGMMMLAPANLRNAWLTLRRMSRTGFRRKVHRIRCRLTPQLPASFHGIFARQA